METPALPVAFGLATLVLILALVAVRLSRRFGLPSLLLYLGIGMVLGNTGHPLLRHRCSPSTWAWPRWCSS